MSFTEGRKLTDTKPFYAAAGCGDLAVEKLREVPDRLHDVQGRLQGLASTDRGELQQRALTYAGYLGTKATSTYDDLARRGRSAVERVRGQEATQELEARAKAMSRQTKAAVTSARKTAASARKAADEGADTIG